MTFNVEKGNVYVEHVIQTGASLTETYNGNVYKGTDGSHDQIIDEETDGQPQYGEDEPKSRYEKIGITVSGMISENIITHKNEMVSIVKVINDENIVPELGISGFVDILTQYASLSKDAMPNKNDLKNDDLRGKYPNWKIEGARPMRIAKYLKIAREFLDRYNELD